YRTILRRRMRGVTLMEILIGALVGLVVLGLLAVLMSRSALMSAKGGDASETLRTSIVVLETIRRDLSRAVFQDPGDLVIADGGHGFSMLASRPFGRDPWSTDTEVVTYRLLPVPGPRSAYRVVREDASGAHR